MAPAVAQEHNDLFDRPVLAADPGMHTSRIDSLAVDPDGRFVVTGGADRTVRIWSTADGKLLRTIWIPVGPDPVGAVYAVAISPDGSTVAAGGWTERLSGGGAIYLFSRETGDLIRRIRQEGPTVVHFLTFSADGRYLAATRGAKGGVQVFDRDEDWGEAFRDSYDGDSYSAAFAPDGHLATTSYGSEGTIRLYEPHGSSFRLIAGPVKAPSGNRPYGIAFSPDGRRLAVGYSYVAAVDLLDGRSLDRLPGPSPTDVQSGVGGLAQVTWSRDGRTLFAAGGALQAEQFVLLAWGQEGLGQERRFPYCGPDSAAGIGALPDGRILVASTLPCLGLMSAIGQNIWTVPSPLGNFVDRPGAVKVSRDGKVVDFGFGDASNTQLRFDVRSLRLNDGASNDGVTFAPNREGLKIDNWKGSSRPTLDGRAIPIERYDTSESLAVAQDGKRFFLGSGFALAALDDTGAVKWRRVTRAVVWAVNASRDGQIVVAGQGDGTIRWRRADDGSELLALQVLPNKTDWVLWTPEGFYAATPGAEDVLKWVVNDRDRPADNAATTFPVSAIDGLRRPDALKLVIDQLETARALGIAEVAKRRLLVQTATRSLKPPGAQLHVLAIGIDHFGDNAGPLHLDYAVADARDVASALLSQKSTPDKATLYADVSSQYLHDESAGRRAILEAMDAMARTMRSEQDVAVILLSTHGAMLDGEFYLVPYGFEIATPTAMETSGISVTEFARKVKTLGERGKVLLLLDACHAGAVGPGGSAANLDASVLRDAVNMDTVTVLTSSRRNEPSLEREDWKHGAFTRAFLDALSGGADMGGHGVITMGELASAMETEVEVLTKGEQHLGPHVNFLKDQVFVVSH